MSDHTKLTQPDAGDSGIPDSFHFGYSDCFADRWDYERLKEYSDDDYDAYLAGRDQCMHDEQTGRGAYQINYQDE